MNCLCDLFPLALAAIGTALILTVHFVLQLFPGQDRESHTP